ncbi:MAG: permease [Dehalococcoidia bacterium]
MIAGHFGLAAAVKAAAPTVPLWALMLATVWLDVVFGPLAALGVERIEVAAGTDGGYAGALIHAPYTHSLVGAALLGALFGLVASRWWGRRAGIVLGLVVCSHWLLDLVVHRADLPLLPGNAGGLPLLGLGVWETPVLAMAVEAALILGGAWLYWRAARAAQRASGGDEGRAMLLGGLVLVAGLLTLSVDVLLG